MGVSPTGKTILNFLIPNGIKLGKIMTFLQLYESTGYQNIQPFICSSTSDDNSLTPITEAIEELNRTFEHVNDKLEEIVQNRKRSVNQETITDRSLELEIPPENRTLFLNCSLSEVTCLNISCSIHSFTKSLNTARIYLKMILNVTILGKIFLIVRVN